MDAFHLAERPCVAAAIEAAAACSTLDELDQAMRDYDALDLARTQPYMPFHRTGAPHALCIMAEKPEPEDVEAGEPFSGPAGRVMREVLDGAGIDLADVYVFYALPWIPVNEKAPNATQLSSGRPFAYRAIELTRPRAILIPGRHSYEAMFNRRDQLTPLLGMSMTFRRGDLRIPTRIVYHPAFPLRFKTEIPGYARQLRDFANDYAEDMDRRAA